MDGTFKQINIFCFILGASLLLNCSGSKKVAKYYSLDSKEDGVDTASALKSNFPLKMEELSSNKDNFLVTLSDSMVLNFDLDMKTDSIFYKNEKLKIANFDTTNSLFFNQNKESRKLTSEEILDKSKDWENLERNTPFFDSDSISYITKIKEDSTSTSILITEDSIQESLEKVNLDTNYYSQIDSTKSTINTKENSVANNTQNEEEDEEEKVNNGTDKLIPVPIVYTKNKELDTINNLTKYEEKKDTTSHNLNYKEELNTPTTITIRDTIELVEYITTKHKKKLIDSTQIYFNTNEFKLNPSNKKQLLKFFKDLNSDKNILIEISGFADAVGDSDYNLELARKRAVSAFLLFSSQDNLDVSYKVISYGEKLKNFDESNMLTNRRVLIKAYQ